MSIEEILNHTKHRPWDLPTQTWNYYQEWNKAIFLHWQADLTELRKYVPIELEIDLFEGRPWISLVAFTMEKIRPKNLPAFSLISDFNEINIRTYVNYNNKPGVYFLSIEAGSKISRRIAKSLSELPYRYSSIQRQEDGYFAENKQFNDKLEIKYQIGEKLSEMSALDKWLIERYALFQETKRAINEFDIHHLEWPIQEITLIKLDLEYQRFAKLINNKPNLTHYAKGVQVIAWDKK